MVLSIDFMILNVGVETIMDILALPKPLRCQQVQQ